MHTPCCLLSDTLETDRVSLNAELARSRVRGSDTSVTSVSSLLPSAGVTGGYAATPSTNSLPLCPTFLGEVQTWKMIQLCA